MKIQFGSRTLNINTRTPIEWESVLNRVKSTIGRKYLASLKIWFVPFNYTNYTILKQYLPKEVIEETERYFIDSIKKISEDSLLRDYQKEALKEIVKGKKLIALPTGAGKTLVGLAYIKLFNFERSLIVVPNSLRNQWKKEAEQYFGLKSVIMEGDKKTREKIISELKTPYILILNYEKVILQDVLDFLQKNHFNLVILDEAHKIKNHKTKTYKSLKKVKADNVLLLTATPLINSPMDVFNIVNFAHPNYFSYKLFNEKYIVYDMVYNPRYGDYIKYPVGSKNLDQLHEELKPVMVFKTKEEILKDLPPITESVYEVEPSKEQVRLFKYYQDLAKNNKWDIENNFNNILAVITLLRLVSDSPELLVYSKSDLAVNPDSKEAPKIKILKEEILPFLEGKTIIFTEFATMARILYNKLKDYNPYLLTGGMDVNRTLMDFKESDSPLLISTDVINFGVNLQFIQNLIHYELPWSPAKIQQREGRLHRIGQENKVLIIKLITDKSIEKEVYDKLLSKMIDFKTAIAGGKDIDIREVVKVVWGNIIKGL